MGLPRALVDRARRVYSREDPTRPWQEGQPPGDEAYGPWFKVRFRPQSANEVEVPDAGNYSYVDESARLLIGRTYVDGTSLTDPDGTFAAFDADDMLEVESELGTHRFNVNGGVSPLRRRRGIVGYTAQLRRAREPEVATGALPSVEPGADPDTDQPTGVPPDIQVTVAGGAPARPPGWEFEGG